VTRAYVRALAALTLCVSTLAACTGDGGSENGANGESRSAASVIGFDIEGGDSFTWSQKVVGHADCDDVSLENNGAPVPSEIEIIDESIFTSRVPLTTGSNEIVATCGDGSTSEPIVFTGRLDRRPTARIDVAVKRGTVVLDAKKSQRAQPDGTDIRGYTWRAGTTRPGLSRQPALRTLRGRIFRRAHGPQLRLRPPSQDGEYFVTLEISDSDGLSDTSTTYFVVEGGRARKVDMMHENPKWIDDAVVYAPIPPLWGNGGPKAVERKLPYLKRLGVDAVWLWPPTSLRTAGEEYAIEDYFKVDPSWGPVAELKRMVQEAHRLGMYVLVDFVANHMSADGPYFQQAKSDGRTSPYWDFFDRKGGKPTHYFDWTNLPNLNYDSKEVRNMIIESTSHWVRDIGVDGFRMDAVWGVKRRRPDFWPEWRREIKRINPDVLLLAEASATDPYYFSHGFDVAYDWTRELGQWAWASAFEFPEEAGALLRDAITNGGKGYSDDARILRFLNNNDTGIRFIDQHGPDLTRAAATMQFTLPGTPSMFAGDEIGASYEPYSTLTPIRWRDRYNLRPFYERLIRLKHTEPALSSRDMQLLDVNASSATAYLRPAAGGRPFLVVINFGPKTKVRVAGSAALDAVVAPSGGSMRDLLTDKTVRLAIRSGSAAISMPAESAYVLTPEGT
jgi:cyclomaltodextrinase